MKPEHVVAALAFCFCTGPACATADVANLCQRRNETGGETAVVETRLASVPAVMRIPSKVSQPPILLWHGFGPPASER